MSDVPAADSFAPGAIGAQLLAGTDFASLVGQQDAPQPIGGEVAPPELVRMTSGVGHFPGYMEGQEGSLLRSLPTEVLVRLQEQMVTLGLTSRVIPGELDAGTLSGFKSLLAMSNQRRERWQSTLGRIEARYQQSGQGVEDVEATQYLAPRYDTVAKEVKTLFRDRLRRDPTDAEMTLLANEMQSIHRRQFDEAQDAVEAGVGAKGIIAVPQMDPAAEFEARFDQRFAGEVDEVEQTDIHQDNTRSATTVLDGFGRLMGGA